MSIGKRVKRALAAAARELVFTEPEKPIGRVEGSSSLATRSVAIMNQSYVAVETEPPQPGLAAKGENTRYTLTSIRRSIAQLEAQGVRPNAIILEAGEFFMLLRENFNWTDGQPIPNKVTILGLPVKVQQ